MGQAPENPSMDPLLDAILEHVPPPPGSPSGHFSMLVTMTERDSFLGRVATGRIASGQVKVGDKIKILRHNGKAFSKSTTVFLPAKKPSTAQDLVAGGSPLFHDDA